MSLSDIVVKGIGVILALVGLALILSAVGVNLLGGVTAPFGPLGAIVIGALLLGAGIYIVRGGTISA